MDYVEAASQLFDGGWRASDEAEIRTEYGLSIQEASYICALLTEWENQGKVA